MSDLFVNKKKNEQNDKLKAIKMARKEQRRNTVLAKSNKIINLAAQHENLFKEL